MAPARHAAVRPPPLAYRLPSPLRPSPSLPSAVDDLSDYAASADVTTLDMSSALESVVFERDDEPHHRPRSVPRHSPLVSRVPSASHHAASSSSASSCDRDRFCDRDRYCDRDRDRGRDRSRAVGIMPHEKKVSTSSSPASTTLAFAQAHVMTPRAPSEALMLDPVDELMTVSATRSFLFGFFLGLLPLAIPIRWLVRSVRQRPSSGLPWDERFVVYGRSAGLLALVAVIVVVVMFVKLR